MNLEENSINQPAGQLSFNWKKTVWMYFFVFPTLIFIWDATDIKLSVVSAALTFFIVGMGHSLGLHRGIIHRSYETSKAFRNITAYLFVLTGLGSPLTWLTLHYIRDYWQNREDSPKYFQYHHSLLKDYWWYLHVSYIPTNLDRYNIPTEDLKDPWLKWLDKTWYLHVLGACALVWFVFGFDAMIVTMFLRISLTILGHWFVGYVTHKYGYSQFEIDRADVSGKNTWFLGLVSFGEGFHNNHHAHPNSAKFGLHWYEIDFSWYMIKLLRILGIVWNVQEAGKDNTFKKSAHIHRLKWSWPWKEVEDSDKK